MAHPDDHARQAQEDTPRFAPIRLTCPHCGQPLDVVPVLAPPPPPNARLEAPARSSAGLIGRAALSAMQQRLFPFSAAAGPHHQHAGGAANDRDPVTPRPWRTTILVILGIVIIAALLIWFGQPSGGVSETTRPAPAAQPTLATTNVGSPRADEAALLDTLAGYHRAETEAAALLTIEPLLPYLDPTGPFAQRRLAQLAERQRRNAPHRSILVRWGIGAITVDGDTATVVTQETWSNQEAGAVAPEQATVRVTYTLRWEARVGRWLIVESEQMGV
ncbi:hypothetical protein [Candidatus Chloroploca sp. Khr17]|uniref:hypothetical protein n=1 Tax=Candidatus Chloroploca sp. Khr17 TaxID=2496869 RepID=UPI00101BC79C|nr:hypothetical protein [Candidatus Chloroploca sp. Khr17]